MHRNGHFSIFFLQNVNPPETDWEIQCSFFDESANAWSTKGGNTMMQSDLNYSCTFNHLTNFATVFVS